MINTIGRKESFLVKFNGGELKKKKGDLLVSLCNRFHYKDLYYVRIIIDTEYDFISNEMWVKLDSAGKVLDFLQEAGIN